MDTGEFFRIEPWFNEFTSKLKLNSFLHLFSTHLLIEIEEKLKYYYHLFIHGFKENIIILIRLLFISHLALSQSNQDRANNNANEGALKLISIIPRSCGDDELDEDDFGEDGEKYWCGIISLVAIPSIFVVLSMFLCPFWTLCRCCECCCCKKKKPKNEITKCQIYTPFFIVIAFLIVIVTMAALAYGANVDFSGALLHNEGEGEDGNLFSVAEDLTNDAAIKMNAILNITTDIRDNIISAIDDIQTLLADTSVLSTGASALITMLNDTSNLWDNYNVTSTGPNGDTYKFSCDFYRFFRSSWKYFHTNSGSN